MCRNNVEVKENRQKLEKRMTDRQTDRQEKEDGMLMLQASRHCEWRQKG